MLAKIKTDKLDLVNMIYTCINEYPSVNHKLIHVLQHLYCTIGGGFEPCNGRLVEIVHDIKQLDQDIIFESINDMNIIEIDELRHMDTYQILKDTDIIDRWTKRIPKSILQKHTSIYPLSDNFSYLCHIPNNIKPDYLAGAYWVINFILSDNYYSVQDDIDNDFFLMDNKDVGIWADISIDVFDNKFKALKIKKELDYRFQKEFWVEEYNKLILLDKRIKKLFSVKEAQEIINSFPRAN